MDNNQSAHHAGEHNHAPYLLIWAILLGMTLVALGAGYIHLPPAIKGLVLVGVTLAKIIVIAMFFMHLKGEKRDLWILTLSPLALSVIMFAFTYGETQGSATHHIQVRSPQKAAPAAPAAHKEQ